MKQIPMRTIHHARKEELTTVVVRLEDLDIELIGNMCLKMCYHCIVAQRSAIYDAVINCQAIRARSVENPRNDRPK